jgi:HEAT repeat protein
MREKGLGIRGWGLVVALVTCSYVVSGFSRTVTAQQYTFEEVASGLKHKDPDTRLRAIQILKDADFQEAAAPVGELLGDSDDRVQLAAIDAERSLFTLRPISRKKMVGFVLEQRTTVGAASEGQLALKPRLVPPQVLSGLAVALTDRNSRVRVEAVGLIALLSPIACQFSLTTSAKATAVEKPGDVHCAQIGNALIANINSREALLRRSAMQALGRLQYPNAVQALLDQLSYHQNGPDAQAAVEGLAGIGHVASISTFEQLLTSSNASMRRLAVEGLARAGHRDALPQLQQMGQTERTSAVLVALHYATVRLAAPGSSPEQIVTSLRDATLRPLAVQYLLNLAPSTGPALAESLRHQDPDVRRTIADVLGFSADSKVVPALTQAAKDANPDVALAAERALERLKL